MALKREFLEQMNKVVPWDVLVGVVEPHWPKSINLVTHQSKLWFFWPALGWGIGVLAHAAATFEFIPFFGAEWERKQVEKAARPPLVSSRRSRGKATSQCTGIMGSLQPIHRFKFYQQLA